MARVWISRLLLAVLVAAGVAYLFSNVLFGEPADVYEAVRRDLVQTVVASGRVITPRRVSVGAVITGRVVRIPVDEGQRVKRGDVLIALLDEDERAAVLQMRAAVEQAEAKLRQLREVALPAAEHNLAQAQANLTQAQQQYQRTEALREKGFVGQSALDDAARNLRVAEAQLRAAQLQVETNRPSGSDIALAQTALAQARANLRAAQARLDHTVIRAPVDGTLIGRSVEPGNVVQPGRELMVLAPAGETQIVVQIDERNLSQLAVGQPAKCSADAYPGERFAATLFYVNPGVDALRGAVEVKLRVPQPPAYLRQDMTVSVDIEIARSKDAVVIPADAVHDAGGAQPWVLVVKDGRAHQLPVRLGLRGDGRVEVREGLAPGDVVVPSTLATIAPGERVRPVIARSAS
jgi:HlyD family secretion protein